MSERQWVPTGAAGALFALAALVATVTTPGQAEAAAPPHTVAGVPVTSSAVTVSGRGEFASLKITVSQTADLVNQAIGISWTGGTPTTTYQSAYNTNFLQIMECWGNPVTSASTPANADNYVAANPGPPREQCEFGAGLDEAGGTGLLNVASVPYHVLSRQVTYDATPASEDDDNLYADGEVPFDAVDGTKIPHQIGNDQWQNPYYDDTTSNESPFNVTWPGGSGTDVFEADTALEAPGLGCGAPVSSGSTTPRGCWLVIVPRGATDINGQSLTANVNLGSPLDSVNWQNRIAIPLHYRLVASPCPIGANEHETNGSELVTAAMTSWQAKLCATSSNVLGYFQLEDDRVRSQLETATAGRGRLGFLSRPVPAAAVPAGQHIIYAPVTLSGVTISFQVDDQTADQNTGPPVTQLNLTPRLVAKLLTYSYQNADAYRLGGTDNIQGVGTPSAAHYAWLAKNPATVFADPDFQQYNPQVSGLIASGSNGGNLMIELTGSDAAYELWSWILADPSARAFLEGRPDKWGMTVDPYFSINPKVNPARVALSLPASIFPNSDPWCGYIGTTTVPPHQPPLCMTSYRPYSDSMSAVAQNVLLANTLQKTLWESYSTPPGYHSVYSLTPPGARAIMGVTSSDSADRYGVIDASLENAAGQFVAPDQAALLAGEAAMQPSGVPGVLQPNLAATAKAAYPLTMLTYAAVNPTTITKSDCAADAALLNYAAGPGQVPGTALGDLPPGYAPLPPTLTAQTKAAAVAIAKCPRPAAPTGGPTPPPGHGGGTHSPTPPPARTTPPASPSSPAGGVAPQNSASPAPAGGGAGTSGAPLPSASAMPSGGSTKGGASGTAVPSGGPQSVSQGLTLSGATTPQNPAVFGYALPLGAAAGFIAAGSALVLLYYRRTQLLRLRAPRPSWPPGQRRPWWRQST